MMTSTNTSRPPQRSFQQGQFGGRGGRGPGQGGGGNRGGGGGNRRRRPQRPQEPGDDMVSTIVDLARVTRVMAGGKRMRFRACVVVGDGKGRIGMGVKKGADVQLAVSKATEYGKKHMFLVKTGDGTIPHRVEVRFRSAHVLLKPAKPGIGVIAGGSVRTVLEMAGITNIVAKMKGSHNKINNVSAVLRALQELRTREELAAIHKTQ